MRHRMHLTRRTFLTATVAVMATIADSACSRVGELLVEAEPAPSVLLDLAETIPAAQAHAATIQDTPAVPAAPPGLFTAPATAGPPMPALVGPPAPVLVDAMTPAVLGADAAPTGLVYVGLPDPDLPDSIRPRVVSLPNLVRDGGQPWRLRGRLVEVVNHGVLVERSATSGKLRGLPMGNAESVSADGFQFRPRGGGPSPWRNEELEGAENERALEAARFGEVNAYYHANRTLAYVNGLLAELGEPPLPFLRLVVNAHSCSRLHRYREDDGDRRTGRLRPFPGGHYRLPTGRREEGFRHPADEICPTGEVHLGLGSSSIRDSRGQPVLVDGQPYTKNVAHIPGIVVHEVGHHIAAHTADFRANRVREPGASSNHKIHLDEGTADYWAAVLLDTPDIYNWQQAARGLEDPENRDLRGPRTTATFERDRNPHLSGNVWSSALWDVRRALGARATDLMVMKTLVQFSRVRPDVSEAPQDARQQTIEMKDELRDGLAMLLAAAEALEFEADQALLAIFKERGVDPATSDRVYLDSEGRSRRA